MNTTLLFEGKTITVEDLYARRPAFLRFDEVILCYHNEVSEVAIYEKCRLFEIAFEVLKPALDHSFFLFYAKIGAPYGYDSDSYSWLTYYNRNDSLFAEYFHLLEHFQNELLPICESFRGYKLVIEYSMYCYRDVPRCDTGLLASILELPQIKRSAQFKIDLCCECDEEQTELPVEQISDWLNQKSDETERNGGDQHKRFLQIRLQRIFNIFEMWDQLKKVSDCTLNRRILKGSLPLQWESKSGHGNFSAVKGALGTDCAIGGPIEFLSISRISRT